VQDFDGKSSVPPQPFPVAGVDAVQNERPGGPSHVAFEAQPVFDVSGEDNGAYLLRQVAERLSISLAQALRPFKQSTGVYRVLIALTRRNPATMQELIELTLIEPSTLSRTVARMEKQGLTTSGPVEGDGRAVLVTMTDSGRELLDAILPAASAQYEWAVQDIPPEDLKVMRQTLQKMLRNLKVSPIK